MAEDWDKKIQISKTNLNEEQFPKNNEKNKYNPLLK